MGAGWASTVSSQLQEEKVLVLPDWAVWGFPTVWLPGWRKEASCYEEVCIIADNPQHFRSHAKVTKSQRTLASSERSTSDCLKHILEPPNREGELVWGKASRDVGGSSHAALVFGSPSNFWGAVGEGWEGPWSRAKPSNFAFSLKVNEAAMKVFHSKIHQSEASFEASYNPSIQINKNIKYLHTELLNLIGFSESV